MSDRKYHLPETQGVRHVDYKFTFAPTGAGQPVLGEGDPNSSYVEVVRGATGLLGPTGAYGGGFLSPTGGFAVVGGVSGAVQPTGMTGTYFVHTKDPFPAVVYTNAQVQVVGNGTAYTIVFGQPWQRPDLTWVIPFTVFSSGTATDVPGLAGNNICVSLRLRNSQVTP